MEIADDILGLIGRTPLVRLNRVVPEDGPRIVAKLESFNPGGSVKDRIGVSMIEAAEKAGKLKPGGTIVEPTSGNTGVGLAIAAAVKGYHVVCTLPDKVPKEKVRLLEAYGVECVVCPTDVAADDPRSYYSEARRIERERKAFRPDQYSNPANPDAHYRTTGPEIWKQTDGDLAAFVAGMGTGGTITGTGRYLKEQNDAVQIVGIDTVGSILKDYHEHGRVTKEPHTYLVDGIGEDFIPPATDFGVVDDVVACTDEDAYTMTLELARAEGILCGSSGGAAVWGAVEATKELGSDDLVVVLIPDTGERYLSKLNKQWMAEQGLLPELVRED
jgi:cystathionine beta-synthase